VTIGVSGEGIQKAEGIHKGGKNLYSFFLWPNFELNSCN